MMDFSLGSSLKLGNISNVDFISFGTFNIAFTKSRNRVSKI